MKKTIVFLFLLAFFGAASAQQAQYIKKVGNYCMYICMGGGGKEQGASGNFLYDIFFGIVGQGDISCDLALLIVPLFPTLSQAACGSIAPQNDVFVESIALSKQQLPLAGATPAPVQAVAVIIKNTNTSAVGSLTLTISLDGPNTANQGKSCSIAITNIAAGGISAQSCDFGPGITVDIPFDVVGQYVARATITNISNGDTLAVNNVQSAYFSVAKEAKTAIPETSALLLLPMAIIVLIVVSLQRQK